MTKEENKDFFNKKNSVCLSRYKWILSDIKIESLLIELDKEHTKFQKEGNPFKIKYVIAFFISIFALIRILQLYFKQFFTVSRKDKKINSVFLGTGRGYEVNNVHKIAKIDMGSNIFIEGFSFYSFMACKRVDIKTLVKTTTNAIVDFYSVIRLKIPDKIIFLILKHGLVNISAYSYFRSFFSVLKRQHGSFIIYTDGAPLPAYAAIDLKIKIVRTFHGLIDPIHPDVFPSYDLTYVYSIDEQKYLSDFGFKTKVYKMKKINSHSKSVVFFMADDVSIVDKHDLDSLKDLFSSFNYELYLKLHPLSKSSAVFKNENGISYHDNGLDFSSFQCIDKKSNASLIISEIKPSFIVGWRGSTSICEALNMGVIPITLVRHEGVYPIRKRSFFWPSENKYVTDLLNKSFVYNDAINLLKNRC
jgi:hypothetical protein